MLSILSCIAYIIIKQTYFGSSSLYLLSFLSTAMVGLRTNWLYIGLGASNELFKRETVPRVTLNIIGCIVLVEAGSVRLFFLFQILGLLLPLLLTYIWSRRNSKIKSSTGHMTKDSLLKDLQIAIPQLLYTLASFFPLFIVQRESAVNAAILALLLRLRIQFFTFVSPVSDSLISKKLSTGEKFSREWSAKKLLDLFSLIFFTIISFPIFVLFMGVFIEDSDLKFSLWQIIFFTFYISFNIVLLFVNSTQNLQNSNKREVTISIAGLSINSFGVFFGHYAFQLTGAISMMMLSQIVMLVLKLKLRENKLR